MYFSILSRIFTVDGIMLYFEDSKQPFFPVLTVLLWIQLPSKADFRLKESIAFNTSQ